MIEAIIIKIVGSIIGPVIRPFTRGRLEAGVTAKKAGANAFTYIRIKNPGPAEVFIRGARVPAYYRIAKDHTEKSIGEAMDNVDVHVLLRQGEVCDLPIFHYPDRPKDAPSQSVHFLIYWRKTSSTWRWQFPVSASTSTAAVQRISAAVAARRD